MAARKQQSEIQRQREGERERILGQDMVPEGQTPRTHSLLLGPTSYTFHCLPIVHSNYESLKELIPHEGSTLMI